jgi:hypothetical protein
LESGTLKTMPPLKYVFNRGDRYGTCVVLEEPPKIKGEGSNRFVWIICDCGLKKRMRAHILLRAKSCGCRSRESSTLPAGVAATNDLFGRYKAGAKKRSIAWSLTKEQFTNLIQQNCGYCGVEPRQLWKSGGIRVAVLYNGLDRKNNTIGYTEENTVTACEICNKAKRDLSEDEFYEWLDRLVAFRHQKVMAARG